jgi:hypothetical protein
VYQAFGEHHRTGAGPAAALRGGKGLVGIDMSGPICPRPECASAWSAFRPSRRGGRN